MKIIKRYRGSFLGLAAGNICADRRYDGGRTVPAVAGVVDG